MGTSIPETVIQAVNIPFIDSDSAGNYEHMVQAVTHSGESSVAAASISHFTKQTPVWANAAIEVAGFPVRNNFNG